MTRWQSKMSLDWWQDFFDETYLKLWANAESLTLARTTETVAGIQRLLNLPRGATILDVACGHGRIAVPLALAGYRVTGADYSDAMLARARRDRCRRTPWSRANRYARAAVRARVRRGDQYIFRVWIF